MDKNYHESAIIYTRSLCYAEYNGEEYAFALANRSAALYEIEEYESCILDINLCLKAAYPNKLKPKVLIRQAKCFKEMGDPVKMQGTCLDILDWLDKDLCGLGAPEHDKYRKIVSTLIVSKIENMDSATLNVYDLPSIEQNPNFVGASTSVALKFKKEDLCVLAKKDIAVGDILLVEKAYAFAPKNYKDNFEHRYCQYCLKPGISLIPCMKCVGCFFCNESCRDYAWNSFHKWECLALESYFFNEFSSEAYLSLRIAFKAAFAGFPTTLVLRKTFVKQFGSIENNYPYVISSTLNVNSLSPQRLLHISRAAALIVEYLKLKTDFFEQLALLPSIRSLSEKELMVKMGGSIIKNLMKEYKLETFIYDMFVYTETKIYAQQHFAFVACPSAELIKHSCRPNTAAYFLGDVFILKAIVPIKEGDEIVMSYNCVLDEKSWYSPRYLDAECRCDACRNPQNFAFYSCVRCNGAATEVESAGNVRVCICSICKYMFNMPPHVDVNITIFNEALTSCLESLHIGDIYCSLQIATSIFKPTHPVFTALYSFLFHYYDQREDIISLIHIMKRVKYHICLRDVGEVHFVTLFYYDYVFACMLLLEKTASRLIENDLRAAVDYLKKLMDESKRKFELYNPRFLFLVYKLEKQLWKIEQKYMSNGGGAE